MMIATVPISIAQPANSANPQRTIMAPKNNPKIAPPCGRPKHSSLGRPSLRATLLSKRGPSGLTAVPQSTQNLAPSSFSRPHSGHATTTVSPQIDLIWNGISLRNKHIWVWGSNLTFYCFIHFTLRISYFYAYFYVRFPQ